LGINIVVVDDHAVVRAGMKALIQSDPTLNVIGEASGGLEALELIKDSIPDVVVLDLSMPDLDGIQVTRELHHKFPSIKILILTVHEDEAMLREVMQSGALGYILKHAAEKELIEAIKKIHMGEMYVDQKMLPALINPKSILVIDYPDRLNQLTPREIDVLKCIANGYTNRQIGKELNISTRTVEGHRANIYEKLHLHSRAELVRYAKRNDLIK